MSRPADLLDAVLARPDDDAPRLVLADALVERADPRGELIALQCTPDPTDAQQKRIRALLRVYGPSWLSRLGGLCDPRTARFERGFLHAVALRRAPPWRQELCSPDAEHALVRRVEVLADGSPSEHPLVNVLGRLPGVTALIGADGDELRACLDAGARPHQLALTALDRSAGDALLAADLPDLRELTVDAGERVDWVLALLERHPRVTHLGVGPGSLEAWRGPLAGRGLARVDVRIPGWRLSLSGERLDRLDAWPVAEIGEHALDPLVDALAAVPVRGLGFVHVRAGRPPPLERLQALRRAARGTPLLLPASWRRALRS